MDRTLLKFESTGGSVYKLHKLGKNFYVSMGKNNLYWSEDFNEVKDYYFKITSTVIGKDTVI